MKGFKDKEGKFRPTENKKGVRKSRDQSTKTEGVRLKRDRTILSEYKNATHLSMEDNKKVHEKIKESGNPIDSKEGLELWIELGKKYNFNPATVSISDFGYIDRDFHTGKMKMHSLIRFAEAKRKFNLE